MVRNTETVTCWSSRLIVSWRSSPPCTNFLLSCDDCYVRPSPRSTTPNLKSKSASNLQHIKALLHLGLSKNQFAIYTTPQSLIYCYRSAICMPISLCISDTSARLGAIGRVQPLSSSSCPFCTFPLIFSSLILLYGGKGSQFQLVMADVTPASCFSFSKIIGFNNPTHPDWPPLFFLCHIIGVGSSALLKDGDVTAVPLRSVMQTLNSSSLEG